MTVKKRSVAAGDKAEVFRPCQREGRCAAIDGSPRGMLERHSTAEAKHSYQLAGGGNFASRKDFYRRTAFARPTIPGARATGGDYGGSRGPEGDPLGRWCGGAVIENAKIHPVRSPNREADFRTIASNTVSSPGFTWVRGRALGTLPLGREDEHQRIWRRNRSSERARGGWRGSKLPPRSVHFGASRPMAADQFLCGGG